jgi:hypothetical protein
MKHVVVVVPVDADVEEAEHVAEQDGQDGDEGGELIAFGDVEVNDHDGEDDCEDTIAEGFEAGLGHLGSLGRGRRQERL